MARRMWLVPSLTEERIGNDGLVCIQHFERGVWGIQDSVGWVCIVMVEVERRIT